ncbi:MAG: Subtilisin inhibitor-like [Gaiellales bacterium]|jgi:hypothetical protein|nr:Subtilisin inhibitor-like [Gaiellales bacterium]
MLPVLVAAVIGMTLWASHIVLAITRGAHLVIEVSHVGANSTRRYTLHCRPVGGSLPNAKAACDAMDAWWNYHSYSYYRGALSDSCPRTPGTLIATIAGEDVTTSYNDAGVEVNFACPMKADQRALWRTAVGLEPSLPTVARPPGFHTADWIRYSPYPELAILGALIASFTALIVRQLVEWRRERASPLPKSR